MMPTVLFRCDSTSAMGLGHVSRCLALAEGFVDIGLQPNFLGHFDAGGARLLSAASMEVVETTPVGSNGDLGATAQHASGALLTVLDSYAATVGYVSGLQQATPRLALIDDFCQLSRYECAAVVNFTVEAARFKYPCDRLLCCLGPDFLLVRRALRDLRRQVTVRRGDVDRVMIAMGGVDRLNLAGRVLRALRGIGRSVAVRVVVGPTFVHRKETVELLGEFATGSEIVSGLNDLSDEFAQADLCVCSGGLTKYESSYLGVPTAVLSQTREQAAETIQFAARGLAFDLGWSEECDDEQLERGLTHVIEGTALRESLSVCGLELFPTDPTRRTAETLAVLARRPH